MQQLLRINNVSKAYKSFQLDSVSFSVKKSAVTGFIGVNGAGKTTTIKCILGIVHKDFGTIQLCGYDLDQDEKRYKNEIGIVFDEGYFYENLSLNAMKNIISAAYSEWEEDVYKAYIRRFNLDGKKQISKLSKGMRMKYAISLALSHKAEFLIFDEPTSGLDPNARAELLEIMNRIVREEKKTVFFSTHITSDLDKIADQIILIDQGKIVFDEAKESLLKEHCVARWNVKDVRIEEIQHLLLSVSKDGEHITAITRRCSELRNFMPKIELSPPNIEEIMLAYTRSDGIC